MLDDTSVSTVLSVMAGYCADGPRRSAAVAAQVRIAAPALQRDQRG
jgi:hypothetical protein